MIYSLGEKKPSFDADSVWIADSADLIGDVVLNKDVSVWFNVTIRGDNDTITIGEGTNIQDNTVIHTDEGIKVNIDEINAKFNIDDQSDCFFAIETTRTDKENALKSKSS